MSLDHCRQLAILLIALSVPVSSVSQSTTSPGLGIAVQESALSAIDLIAQANGNGFPPGGGSAREGRTVFIQNCAACHGMSGQGVSASTVLVGGNMQSAESPLRTVGSYWPYASTLFDFIRRAMPADAPKSLSDQEVYQVTAYVLFLNDLIAEDTRIDRERLLAIEMPNADGFVDQSHIH